MLDLNIAALLSKSDGAKENVKVDEPVRFDEPGFPRLTGNLSGNASIMRLPHEINVAMRNMAVNAEAVCTRCLKKFNYKIFVPFAEREFIIDLPEDEVNSGEEVFYIKKGAKEISLLEFARQEILLHFPEFPVCSVSCKGICAQCGNDLNIGPCGCKEQIKSGNKPFKFL